MNHNPRILSGLFVALLALPNTNFTMQGAAANWRVDAETLDAGGGIMNFGNSTAVASLEWVAGITALGTNGGVRYEGFIGQVLFDDNVALPPIAPSILQEPLSQVAWPGANVTFNVTASGSEPLHYLWWKDGLALLFTTNAALVLTNVQMADTGSYLVKITNAAGAVTSAPAFLSLHQVRIAGSTVTDESGFGFQVLGSANQHYAVESSTNLTHWNTVASGVLSNGAAGFTDTNRFVTPYQFYRVRLYP